MIKTAFSKIVKVNDGFKNSINLNLNLNKISKISSYIPTQSSTELINEMTESVLKNRDQASLLIGAYGKGKSHLILIVLSVLTLERNENNNIIIQELILKISKINNRCAENLRKLWNKKSKFLPIIINNSYTDLNQAFLIGLNDSLKKAGLENLKPKTYYDAAIENIAIWKSDYEKTYKAFTDEVKKKKLSTENFIRLLSNYDDDSLEYFISIYSKLTSGSKFSPLINQEIQKLYNDILVELGRSTEYKGIYIVFDEFSKFIESKNKISTGNDMKILQDICELANESKKGKQLIFTMIAHKSIKEYGNYLDKNVINSYLGIQGRIKERYFISSVKNNYELIKNAIIKDEKMFKSITTDDYFNNNNYFEIPAFRINYDVNDFKNEVLKGCYPLNPISSYCLINVSEKVAQNERTLFTFISKDERYSMANYIINDYNLRDETASINVNLIYDYFKNIFKEDVSNAYIHNIWLKSEYALDKIKDNISRDIIKALAVMKIVNKSDELPTIEKYIRLALNLQNIEEQLDNLCNNQLLIKRNDSTYDLVTDSNRDLNKEIESRMKKSNSKDIIPTLNIISDLDYELPKKYNQEKAMTRFFKYEFIMDDVLLNINDSKVFFDENIYVDGKIFMIIKTNSRVNEIKEKIRELADNRLIFLYPNKKFRENNSIQKIKILEDIKKDESFLKENPILLREINLFELDLINLVNNSINDLFNLNKACRSFNFKNGEIVEYKNKNINSLVSEVCSSCYTLTPIINNELINKNKINSAVRRAQKEILNVIINDEITDDIFTKTSAADTIFRAVLRNTHILSNEYDSNLQSVMNVFDEFFIKCVENRVCFNELLTILYNKPYGIRKGVIPILFTYRLRNREKDVVIYKDGNEVNYDVYTILDILDFPNNYELFISEESEIKQNYLMSMIKLFDNNYNFALSKTIVADCVELIKKWYRSLPQLSRNITNVEDYYDGKNVIYKSLKKFKNLFIRGNNNYEILFVDIPKILKTEGDLEKTYELFEIYKEKLDGFSNYMIKLSVLGTFDVFNKNKNLHNVLKDWYQKQSKTAKTNLFNNGITGFMNYILKMSVYSDEDITKDIIKIITSSYFEDWNNDSYENYIKKLEEIKLSIELIKDDTNNVDKKYFKYLDANGEEITRYYTNPTDNQAEILKNVLEADIDDFYNLDANDKAAIIVELLKKY